MSKLMSGGIGLRATIVVSILLIALTIAVQAPAQPRLVIQGGEDRHAGEFVVPINKSQVLQVDVPFEDLLVGNSEIADVLALTDRTVYVLGKSLGSTSLTIYGRDRNLIAVMDLVVSPDIEGLKARLYDLMPDETVEIRTINGAVAISGTVSSAPRMDKILAVAERFAPGLITNLMSIEGSQQVLLKVRFVEVSRNVLKSLGLNFDIFKGDFAFTSGDTFLLGANSDALRVGDALTLAGDAFGAGAFRGRIGEVGLNILFEALEEKGVAKTLAEPNLMALSGDTATFLAGGEFPIEVAQSGSGATGDAAITIEFKEFGVALAFTPTVLDDGLINLVVTPEVSAIDESVSVRGTPGLTTRRATTTVELRDGQSFAIAGLIQDDFNDTIRQVPLLAEAPVLGALFRSSEFQKRQTELVIIVEPKLVRPAPAGSLATPADNFIPPSEADIWLFGRLEAPESGLPRGAAMDAEGAGGIDGHFGHIIK